MKAIQANLSPLSFRCAMPVLFLVFLIPATSSAQTAQYTQSFESYEIGTSASNIENVLSYGVWDHATVVNGGPDGSKELCVTPDPFGDNRGTFYFGTPDFPPPIGPIPLGGSASASFSFDFRVQTVGTAFSNTEMTRIANGGIWEDSSNNVWTSLWLNRGYPGNELVLVLGGSDTPIITSRRSFDALGFDLDAPGEWSKYFSLQLNVELNYSPNSPASGVAVANLVDAAGNVLLSTSERVSSLQLVSSTTGKISPAYIYTAEDSFDPLFAACYDNLSHSVTFVPSNVIGDANGDGVVDFSDIPAFISILASGGYLAQADANEDGVVDFMDIPPFIDILIGL